MSDRKDNFESPNQTLGSVHRGVAHKQKLPGAEMPWCKELCQPQACGRRGQVVQASLFTQTPLAVT